MTAIDQSRRLLLAGMGAMAGAGLAIRSVGADAVANASPTADTWEKVRAAYTPSSPMMNLNNAGVSPQPLVVQEAMIQAYRFANGEPDVNMWEVLDATRTRTKEKLAKLAGCAPGEIALNRNSTEGLCTAIYGIDLQAGDEVLLSDWDYGSMQQAWELRARRHGIVIKRVAFDAQDSDEQIIAAYRQSITPRTRVLHFTHMLHTTGRVLPGKALCTLASQHQLQSVVDAAQSFAQVPLSFRDMGCDYLAVSLHKWLCAPFGTGMLIVRKERIDALWPLLAPLSAAAKGIDRIDGWNLGTYASPAEHAIEHAIDFHNSLGTAAISERLRFLTRYWLDRARAIPGLKVHTPLAGDAFGAVSLISIDGLSAEPLEQHLREQHRIRTRYRQLPKGTGLRVSPHIYTSVAELDRFVDALAQASSKV
jgi:selenocysteine lyase/cysteine desulfurase